MADQRRMEMLHYGLARLTYPAQLLSPALVFPSYADHWEVTAGFRACNRDSARRTILPPVDTVTTLISHHRQCVRGFGGDRNHRASITSRETAVAE